MINLDAKKTGLLALLLAMLAAAPLPAANFLCDSPRDRRSNGCSIATPQQSTTTSAPFYITSTVAGTATVAGYTGDGGNAYGAELSGPLLVAFDPQGNYYIVDNANRVIRQVTPAGVISTFAGTNTFGYSGDGGPAVSAQISTVEGIVVDQQGNVYIADTDNARIRVINTAGVISTFAGNGTRGYSGDFGQATSANLFYPAGLNVDSQGNIYVADFGNGTVREVNTSGVIHTIAGNGSIAFADFQGTGTTVATRSTLGLPWSVAIDSAADVYFSDIGSSYLREVTPDGLLHTLLSGVAGSGLNVDASGNLYYADFRAGTVSKLPPGGTPTLLAGDSIRGYSGDGGASVYSEFLGAYSAAFDKSGNIYVADSGNDAIRRLSPLPAATLLAANAGSNIAWTINSTTGVASGQQAIAPGEVLTLTSGVNLGPSSASNASADANGFYETQLNGTTVTFNGIAAPILAVSPTQVVVITPYEVSGLSRVTVSVLYNGATVVTTSVPVTDAEPEFFTAGSAGINGLGPQNSNGSLNTIENAAPEAGAMTFYVTGEGIITPTAPDGQVTVSGTTLLPVQTPTVTVNGTAATVAGFGEATGLPVGILAIGITLPSGITTTNAASVVVTVGSHTSLPIYIAVQ